MKISNVEYTITTYSSPFILGILSPIPIVENELTVTFDNGITRQYIFKRAILSDSNVKSPQNTELYIENRLAKLIIFKCWFKGRTFNMVTDNKYLKFTSITRIDKKTKVTTITGKTVYV